jgi:Ser/Thr protein kinase RdoA (MazF antagonist)
MNSVLDIAHLAIQHWDCIVGPPEFVMHRENAVFKVKTSTGFAALRIHRTDYRSRVEIESELQWMAHLDQAGIEVPTPFVTRNGNYVAEVSNDQRQSYSVDLLVWLDGEPLGTSRVPLAYSKQQLECIFLDVGSRLARMHAASDQWKKPRGFSRHALNREGLVGETAAWGKFWEATCLTPDEKKLMVKARQLAATKLDILSESGADYGLIHADLVRENILVADRSIRFIDFDDAGFGFRMFDLAVALVKNREEPHYESIKTKLFDGYKSVRQLSTMDERSLDLFLALRDFAYLGWADARREEIEIGQRLMQIKRETLKAAHEFLNRESGGQSIDHTKDAPTL